jgi:hypothetical protein
MPSDICFETSIREPFRDFEQATWAATLAFITSQVMVARRRSDDPLNAAES